MRHGQSVANVTGHWQGQGDSPLSDLGRDQAQALARRFYGQRWDRVVSSPLTRAHDTARALGLPVDLEPGLQEIDVGRWEGLRPEEVEVRFPDELSALARGEMIAIGGIGESWADLAARVGEALQTLRASLPPNGRALVFSHGGVISTIAALALGVRDRRPRPLGRIVNTSVTTLRYHDDGALDVLRYNDASHLGSLGSWTQERHAAGNTVITLVGHDPNGPHDPAELPAGRLRTPVLLGAERVAAWYRGVAHLYAAPGLRDAAMVLANRWGLVLEEADASSKDDVGPAVHACHARHAGARVGIVASPPAIVRYALDLMGRGAPKTQIAALEAGGVAHIVASPTACTLADYNAGPGSDRPPRRDSP